MIVLQLQNDRDITKENSLELIRDYACNRIRHNKNHLSIFVGGTGSGKSMSALAFAEMTQKKLLPDVPFTANNVVFKGSDFVSKIQGKGQLPSKSVILWDEVSVFGLNSRRSMSNINIMLNNVFNTFRHQNYVVVLTTPDFANIDVVVRKLLHTYVKTCNIDFKKKLAKLEVQYMQYNPRFGRIYYHTFQIQKPSGDRYVMKHFHAPLPSPELIKEYEKKKKEFTDELNQMVQLKISEMEAEEIKTDSQKENEKRKHLTGKQEEVYNMLCEGFTQNDIAESLGIKQPVVSIMAKTIKSKGYEIIDNREKPMDKEKFNDIYTKLRK